MSKLGLGTVQFGLPYGIANERGQVSLQEAAAMLRLAGGAGIVVIDTAAEYGESEATLGRVLPRGHSFRIVTKTPQLAGLSDLVAAERVEAIFRRSLERLGQDRVYGLLAHDANDLLRPQGAAAWAAMQALRRRGLVERIGASVYTEGQIDRLSGLDGFDLIQVPFSVFDQRLRGGPLDRLRRAGVEVHARSAFLQGLAFLPPERAQAIGRRAASSVATLRSIVGPAGIAAAVLSVPLRCSGIGTVVVGATGCDELASLIEAASVERDVIPDVDRLSVLDDFVVNPALWSPKGGFLPILTGDRVALRRLSADDVSDAYVGWLEDPEVTRYLETRFAVQDRAAILAFVEAKAAKEDEFLFGIFRRDDQVHIGNIKIGPVLRPHRQADISFFIGDRESWGRGYATEAIRLVTKFGFEVLGLNKLSGGVYATNLASRRSFEKAGWREEGALRRHLRSGEDWVDLNQFGFCADDYWAAAR